MASRGGRTVDASLDLLADFSLPDLPISGLAQRMTPTWTKTNGRLARRVLVGVDDIPARWTAQRAADAWLCVAGTSHFLGMVTTHRSHGPCAGCAHPRDEKLDSEIPTISFVSFWAGLLQARRSSWTQPPGTAAAPGYTSHRSVSTGRTACTWSG
jgi:hypothetical protein